MPIAGYRLRINGGSLTDQVTDVGNVFSHIFTGLDPSTEYAVEVASYDEEDVQSNWSAAVYATTDAAPEMFMVIDDLGNDVTDDNGALVTVLL